MKKFKYSGKTDCMPGEMLILQEDGSVITHREKFPPCKRCNGKGYILGFGLNFVSMRKLCPDCTK